MGGHFRSPQPDVSEKFTVAHRFVQGVYFLFNKTIGYVIPASILLMLTISIQGHLARIAIKEIIDVATRTFAVPSRFGGHGVGSGPVTLGNQRDRRRDRHRQYQPGG
ncbi:MAG: hypothetical protein JNM79_03115 [Burkholderiales bacterium]|nr:hypothetical protein [Burkholderiales bacterium]